jgi:hypothetical protein
MVDAKRPPLTPPSNELKMGAVAPDGLDPMVVLG